MKAISRVLMVLAVLVLTAGCATSTGFAPGAGGRILDTTLKGALVGTVVGAGVGVLGEVFGGGDDHRGRNGVFAPGGYGHGGYDYGRYNSPAEAVNARRYRAMQREEEARRQEAIWAERRRHRR